MIFLLNIRLSGRRTMQPLLAAIPPCVTLFIGRIFFTFRSISTFSMLEQINFEKVYLLCKDLPANPCREMLAGGLCLPLSKHFKRKML
jgi:hypothetical protein